MLIRKIKLTFENNRLLFIVFIVSTLFTVNSYISNTPISPNDLVTKKGILKEIPSLHKREGDLPSNFIRIKFSEDEKNYDLTNCAFYESKQNSILKLKPGDSIIVTYEYRYISNNCIDICSLTTNNNIYLLKLDNYNNCYISEWKEMLYIDYFIFILIIFSLLNNIGVLKKIRNSLFGKNN